MTWDCIIGIDCATAAEKTGLARAVRGEAGWVLVEAMSGAEVVPVEQVAEWISAAERPLLCIDAPLGWPVALGQSLAEHRAGAGIGPGADELFHRRCDSFIHERTGCRPMEVGANFIARTARAALGLLAEVREHSRRHLPLLWHPGAGDEGGVIEVYPAATLRMHELPWRRYKPAAELERRDIIMEGFGETLALPGAHSAATQALRTQADVLDAAVCILAGIDFLEGQAMAPPRLDEDLAKEGWIWTRRGSAPSPA
ncbi:DUF429 domain-containing protein [Natronospira bacteriovora]|uniref:DUF429 domain-containing protein n=1 Tax=Natronospira bacteriovora TaxID=3069753 RepID=A0ABU0W472_9GAMM|nr:DUF429 domain-containing protein [Natronospira sp. AB-CW4]MDQ2068766.1 DUF429 domain-containing protein [Natronospira sp. AB-CW4]